MAKSKYPKTVFVTRENDDPDSVDMPYFLVNETAGEALEATEGDTVAEYQLVRVRKGEMVPQFDDE